MGDIISLDEYRQRKLGAQFDIKKKKKPSKQVIRERRANEMDEALERHPSKNRSKKLLSDDE